VGVGELEKLHLFDRAYLSHDILQRLVQELRVKYGSQRKAAKALGLHNSFFSLWLHGKQCSARVEVLLKILRVLGRRGILVKNIEPLGEYRRRSVAKVNAKKKQPDIRFSSIVTKDLRGC